MASARPPHLQGLYDNFGQVAQLTKVHEAMTGTARGRRFDMDIVNASGIVLSVACWEAFVEDLAELAFEFLVANAPTPDVLPAKVLVLASKPLQDAADKREVWKLAGEGWRNVLDHHKRLVLSQYLGGFNTPRQPKIDVLFEQLIGLKDLSGSWLWHKNSTVGIVAKLDVLVGLRGQIAHRVKADRYVTKTDVLNAKELILRLAVSSSNAVGDYLKKTTGTAPWPTAAYGSVG